MKVLHIEDWFHPEVGYQINFFAKYHHSEIDFTILTSNAFSIWPDTNPQEIIEKKDLDFEKKYAVRIIRLKAKTRNKKHNIWLLGLHDAIEKIKPDIIFLHAIESLTALRVILSKKIVNHYKIVVDTHTLYNQFGKGYFYRLFLSFFRSFISAKINKMEIIAFYTALENKSILEEVYKIKPNLIKNCQIGTDLNIYRFNKESRLQLRKTLNISEKGFVILYTGKLDFHKQPHLILEALTELRTKMKETYIIFVGSKNLDYFNQYFNYEFDENFQIKVLPAVRNEELYHYYSMADISVFPKQNTLSALDAQACCLTVIMEDDATNRERLQKGGLLYKQENMNDLADKIFKTYSDPVLLKQLSQNGFNYISENYNYTATIKNMESVLFSLSTLNG
jgi:glycosyltransferase involved in cell wall biosynthesis